MAFEFTMPDMGDMDSADVGSVKVKEGDRVAKGQPILEMEGEKAVFDVESPEEGTIVKLMVKAGDTVKTGQPLAMIDTGAKGSNGSKPAAEEKKKPAASAKSESKPKANGAKKPSKSSGGGEKQFRVPDMGDMESADVGEVHVSAGAKVTEGQAIASMEGEKAVFDLESPYAGTVVDIKIKAGDKLKTGDLVAVIRTEGSDAEPEDSEPTPPDESHETPQPAPSRRSSNGEAASPRALAEAPAATSKNQSKTPAPAGPATRRLARQLGVDLHQVSGSGPGGRITREDLHGFVRKRLSQPSGGGGGIAAPALPDFEKFGPIHREPLNKIGQASARNLAIAWSTIPHVTQHDVADITELEAGRKRFNAVSQAGRPKVTMTAFIMKAAVAALKQYPHFNSSYDAQTQEVIYKRYYHLGVAVDTPHGLVVPVIRDVDKKSIRELAAELAEVADKARERKLGREAMSGGTFTITNLGGIGGTAFTPIVNWPEVAILGISKARWEYVIDDKGSPHVRLLMPLSLSYDHRVVNGADGARFLRTFAELMSDVSQLVIEA